MTRLRQPAEGRSELRVALYEPAGLGGICHYSWELAEALHRQGCRVLLVTSEEYELDALPRRFQVKFLFRRSRMKRLLGPLGRVGTRPAARSPGAAGPVDAGERRRRFDVLDGLRRLRIRFLETGLALWLVWHRFDVVHFQSIRRGRDLYLVRLLSRLGLGVLYTAHDLLPHEGERRVERQCLSRVYAAADRVVVHARANRMEILSLFALDARRVVVIPHGGYRLLLPAESVSRRAARERVGFPLDRPLVLFFGLVKRYKGLEYLIDAFQRVEREMPQATLAVVGNLYRADHEAYAFHVRLLQAATKSPNVISVPRYVPLADVGFYLSAADVVALPYVRTYQSGVLLAALAAGRPVVVTDTGGLPEVVRDGEAGFVVPPRDGEALAGALLRLLRDPELAARMGRQAAHRSVTEYGWDGIAERTRGLYEAVLEERRGRSRAPHGLALDRAARERKI